MLNRMWVFYPYDHGKRIANWMGTGMKNGGPGVVGSLLLFDFAGTSPLPQMGVKLLQGWSSFFF